MCHTRQQTHTRILIVKGETKTRIPGKFYISVSYEAAWWHSGPTSVGTAALTWAGSQAGVGKGLGAQGQLGSLLPLWYEADTWRPSAATEELDIKSSRDHSRDEKKPEHILYPQSHPRQLSHWFHNCREGMPARTGNDCIQKQRGLSRWSFPMDMSVCGCPGYLIWGGNPILKVGRTTPWVWIPGSKREREGGLSTRQTRIRALSAAADWV